MDNENKTPSLPLAPPTTFDIMAYIEAGLRNEGIEQEFINEAKRQIHDQILLYQLSPEERAAKLEEYNRQKKGVRNPDSAPMPSQDEINKMYAKDHLRKSSIDAASQKSLIDVQSILDAIAHDEKVRSTPSPKPVKKTFWSKVRSYFTFRK